MQRLWLAPHRHELILERTFLNHAEQKVTFLGVPKLTGPDGTPLHASTGQPLFYVEHSVGGSESQPVNRWRIVHLTETTDDPTDSSVRAHGPQPLARRAHRDLHPPQPRHPAHPEARVKANPGHAGQRDSEETARIAAYPLLTGHFRRRWQVLGSNQRKRSRPFYSTLLLPEAYAADQHQRAPRRHSEPPPSAMRP